MDTTYEKTDDGQLSVVSTTSTKQTYTVASIQDTKTQAEAQMDSENIRHSDAVATIQANIDAADALLAQAISLGLSS